MKVFLAGRPQKLRKTIKAVCSDMYDGCIYAAKEVIGKRVKVVMDRFHVAKWYGKGLDVLRKQECKRLQSVLPQEEYKQLQGAMWVLRKQGEKSTEKDKDLLEHLFIHTPLLKVAYDLCNALTEIFEKCIAKSKAKSQIKNWIQQMKDSGLHCFDTFIKT